MGLDINSSYVEWYFLKYWKVRTRLVFAQPVTYQDTQSCVTRPSLGAQDSVCYLPEPTFSCFWPFIAQNYWANFNQNHVLDTLQSHYLMYKIWKELVQQFPRYVVPKVVPTSSYFSSSLQHSLIRLKTSLPYFEFCQICTVNIIPTLY